MDTKFFATSLDKLSTDIRIEVFIAGLTLASVVLPKFRLPYIKSHVND
jgi:hypothetical protein